MSNIWHRTRVFALTSALALALVGGCWEEMSAESTGSADMRSAVNPPTRVADPPVKSPMDWKLQRDSITALAFSPDGKTLTAVCDSVVFLWDTVKGERRMDLKDPPRSGVAIAWSPDGTLLASGAAGGGVSVWNASTGEPVVSTRFDRGVKAVAFADNGATLLVATYNDTHVSVQGLDSRSGKERFSTRIKGHVSRTAQGAEESREPGAVCFSPDGTLLATAAANAPTRDLNVRLWNVRTGQEHDHFGITGSIEAMAFSPDGGMLGATDHAGQVRLWNLRDGGKSLGILGTPDQRGAALAFSPDGTLVAASSQRVVRMFKVADRSAHSTIEIDIGAITALGFSPGGGYIALADNLGRFYVRSVPLAQPRDAVAPRDTTAAPEAKSQSQEIVILEEQTDPRSARPYLAVAFSTDGKTVAASGEDRIIRLFDASGPRLLFVLEGQLGIPLHLDFSRDGALLVSAATDLTAPGSAAVEPAHSVRVWDVSTGKDRGHIVTQKQAQAGACFSPDGKSLAAADRDGVVRLFDVATLQARDGFSFAPTDASIGAICFAPDGARLAVGTSTRRSMAGRLHVLDLATGRELFAHDLAKPVTSIAISPDGRWLAAVGGEIKVYEVSTGREVASPQHRYYPSCAAFSPDGKTLATSGAEIKLWDVGSWKQRSEYTPQRPDEFRSIAWSPDGSRLAVAGARRVFLWTPRAH